MTAATTGALEQIEVDGVRIDLVEAGSGGPLQFLHGMDGVDPDAHWFRGLAANRRLIAPVHPGFGHSERPDDFRSVADLAYFHLELARHFDLQDAVLMGASFGGWIAAEMAVRSTACFSRVVLIDPLGIKVGGPTERHITDMHALSQADLAAALYHDPVLAESDYASMDDAQLLGIARSREAFAYYGWKPYMHNPGLRRWLRRIRIPVLIIWGESDGIVDREYVGTYANELPDARLETIARAAHYPHVEQPERFLELVEDFLGDAPAGATG